MLFLDPVPDYRDKVPSVVWKAVDFLARKGFDGSVAGDLEKINLGLPTPLVESQGCVRYDSIVVGYIRAHVQ